MTDKPLYFLVVDDDPESRASIVEYLKAMGHDKIVQAKDGAEASRILDRDPNINFIISDWEMPLMNGLTLLQRVRSNPGRANTPFLIVTSPISEEAEKIVMAAESYVDGYLIKPFRSQALQEKITKMLAISVHGPQKTAVVVDDDPDALAMMVEYLKQMGFKSIHQAHNGKEALDYIKAEQLNIGMIVADWEMPEMSGIDLLRAVKSQSSLAGIPFLIVTSQTSMEKMKVMQAARESVDDYLLKPFQFVDLKKRVDAVIDRARTRTEVQGYMTEAQTHFESGRFARAQVLYEQVLSLDPNHDGALRALGDTVLKLKGSETALPFYKKAVEANPLNPKGYVKLAMAYDQVGLTDKAIALIQTANKQIGFSADLHFHLGRLYQKRGDFGMAKAEFEKTLEIQLDHQEARLMLAMLNSGRGD